MAAATTMIHVRVDEQIKAQATQTLAAMGLTVSDAVRVFLTRVVTDQELPFALKAPNAESIKAMAEAQDIIASRQARFDSADALIHDLEENSSK
jgi:DNA-damage-inducible protein J